MGIGTPTILKISIWAKIPSIRNTYYNALTFHLIYIILKLVLVMDVHCKQCLTSYYIRVGLVYTLSTEFSPLIFQTLALKNIHGQMHDLWRIYFHTQHQDLLAGWCSGFTLTSWTEGPGLYPRLMQVIQLSH